MNFEEFCSKNNLQLSHHTFLSILETFVFLFGETFNLVYIQKVVNDYIKENFYSTRIQRFIFQNQTLKSLQDDVMNCIVNDNIALQALSSNLEVEVHFLSFSGNKIHDSIYPKKEPEVTYHTGRTVYILKTHTNICQSYSVFI